MGGANRIRGHNTPGSLDSSAPHRAEPTDPDRLSHKFVPDLAARCWFIQVDAQPQSDVDQDIPTRGHLYVPRQVASVRMRIVGNRVGRLAMAITGSFTPRTRTSSILGSDPGKASTQMTTSSAFMTSFDPVDRVGAFQVVGGFARDLVVS